MTEFKNGDKVTLRNDMVSWWFVGYHPHDRSRCIVYNIGRPYETEITNVMPYREPVKVAGWVNVYPDGVGATLFDKKGEADFSATLMKPYPVACIYVSGTEGVEP